MLVVPICLWGEATHIDTAGRFKLEPWTFSPLIFTEKTRRNKDFWGMLGYVKFLKESTAQKQTYQKGDTTRMYHKQLSAILASLQLCDEKLKNVAIPFDNNEVQYYDITCPVMFVMSDTEGADRICGRYGSHRLKIKRHCRMCDVNSDNLDDEKCKFNYLSFDEMHHIAINGTEEQRVKYYQHKVANAFWDINLGKQKYGLLGCTPPDILHVVRKGIVEWSARAVIENLSTNTKKNIRRSCSKISSNTSSKTS